MWSGSTFLMISQLFIDFLSFLLRAKLLGYDFNHCLLSLFNSHRQLSFHHANLADPYPASALRSVTCSTSSQLNSTTEIYSPPLLFCKVTICNLPGGNPVFLKPYYVSLFISQSYAHVYFKLSLQVLILILISNNSITCISTPSLSHLKLPSQFPGFFL